MFMRYLYVFFLFVMLMVSCKTKENQFLAKKNSTYVNPMIGTGGHGHTYPGATVPFGMVQLSPVNGISSWDWCSGYHYSDSIVVGFSHLSLSGTGIGDLNDILFMPATKAMDLTLRVRSRDSLAYKSYYSHANETAAPGYYQLYLEDPRVNAEFTTSRRTGFHKYTFQDNADASVVIDLGFAINWDKPLLTGLSVEDVYTVTGYRHTTGWAKNQKVFFAAKFSEPITNFSLYKDFETALGNQVDGEKTSGQLFFGTQHKPLFVKVALSSVSVANAMENLEANLDFDSAKAQAEAAWESHLGSIVVETPIDSLKTLFYTALYHAQLAPVTFSDANGQFRKENDSIVTAKNYTAYSTLSLWDTFRAQNPLLTIIAPDKVAHIIKSMHEYYKETDALPVWTLYANETNTMTGNHSIPVIVDAYFKGIKDFDVEALYNAMKATMMNDKRGLNYYKQYGYIPYDMEDESVTISLEYAFNDWCVAQMAKALGKKDDYEFFSKRSKAYEFLFDKETGFMRGRSADNTAWRLPFDPKHSNHREDTDYTEGNAWQHSWFVPHDVAHLIALHGGDAVFTERLERLFTEPSEITGDNVSADISGLIGQYAHGNEPSHHIAYMFNKANKPWRTQYWVRHILNTQYNTTPNGLSGNEDCGQMSAWYVLSSIGLYPLNAASSTYEIGSPLFEKTTINIPGTQNKRFTITAENVSQNNLYIQSASLNGKAFNQTFIPHKTLVEGGELHLVMGDKPNLEWGVNN